MSMIYDSSIRLAHTLELTLKLTLTLTNDGSIIVYLCPTYAKRCDSNLIQGRRTKSFSDGSQSLLPCAPTSRQSPETSCTPALHGKLCHANASVQECGIQKNGEVQIVVDE